MGPAVQFSRDEGEQTLWLGLILGTCTAQRVWKGQTQPSWSIPGGYLLIALLVDPRSLVRYGLPGEATCMQCLHGARHLWKRNGQGWQAEATNHQPHLLCSS